MCKEDTTKKEEQTEKPVGYVPPPKVEIVLKQLDNHTPGHVRPEK